MGAETIDTQRAIQLLSEIQKARAEHAESQADYKRLTGQLDQARNRVHSLEDRVKALHEQFNDLTNPVQHADQADSDEPTTARSAERSRRARKNEPQEETEI